MIVPPTLTGKDIPVWFQKQWQLLTSILNGHLSFGDGTKPGNLDGVWVTVTTSTSEFSVTHNLGRVPVGFIVFSKSAVVDLYKGTTSWTSSTIYLVGTVGGVSVLLFVV